MIRTPKESRPFQITRTELVWPGKYDENGNLAEPPRISLPFQVIEVIEEGRTSREQLKQLNLPFFGVKPKGPAEDGWRNKLIWGDNLLVEASLLTDFAGKIDLIYIDPPFATGADFSVTTVVGEGEQEVTKQATAIEEKAYRDTWGQGIRSYLAMMNARLTIMKDLLSDVGSIYVHCDWRMVGALRLIMDEIFGCFENLISWKRSAIAASVKTQWRNSQDFLLFYSKSGKHIFNPQFGEYSESSKKHYNKSDSRGVFRTVPLMASGRTSGPSGQAKKRHVFSKEEVFFH